MDDGAQQQRVMVLGVLAGDREATRAYRRQQLEEIDLMIGMAEEIIADSERPRFKRTLVYAHDADGSQRLVEQTVEELPRDPTVKAKVERQLRGLRQRRRQVEEALAQLEEPTT